MKYVSMFSGIEAASAAWHPLGWTPVAFAEIEPFPSAVLAHHYPTVPNVGDMTKQDWSIYKGKCDGVVGGPPCQAFSVAGLRKSLQDHRGNLSLEYVRAVDAIDPVWCLTENVPGWLSTKDNAFGCFLAAMVGEDDELAPPAYMGGWPNCGAITGPRRTLAWRILDAQFFGVAQRRRRVFVLTFKGSGNWKCAAALFPVCHSLSGNPAPRREKGQGAAPTLAARTNGGGGLGTDFDCDGGLIPEIVGQAMSAKWSKGSSGPAGDECHNLLAVAHTLKGEGFGASEDGTGRGTPQNGAGHGARSGDSKDEYIVPVAFGWQNSHHQGDSCSSESTPTLDKSKTPAVSSSFGVRRLTPGECEKLQGFSPGYTAITFKGKPAADSPRYKALGNSMAVPHVAWIGRRIALVDPLTPPRAGRG